MFSFGRQVGSAPDEILPALLFYFNFQGLRTEIGVLYVEAVRFPCASEETVWPKLYLESTCAEDVRDGGLKEAGWGRGG
jgi:hypothetical protein